MIRDVVFKTRSTTRLYWPLALAFILVASLLPLYTYLATGSPFTNLYTLWWPFDTVGFGPGIGTKGHTWLIALANLFTDWPAFFTTMIGWPTIGGLSFVWIGILFGLLWLPWHRHHLWLIVPPLCLVCAYLAYWAFGDGLFGARYYAEALPFVWILIARGLTKLASRSVMRWGIPLLVVLLTICAAIPLPGPGA